MPRVARSPSPTTPRATLAAALLLALLAPLAAADESKPARKDSPARAKPRSVSVVASVAPAEARPGDTVTYKVTAKLDPGFHIYTFATKQPDSGPRNTEFDLFDTGGLKVAGEWTADKEPTRKKEPVFPELDFVSFFDGEVTWSLPLKVPAGAAPGRVSLRGQASYQVCNATSCSFPGRWTLPAVELTVLPAAANAGAAPPAPAPLADAKAPKAKESPERIRPKVATLTTAFEPAEARPGETVAYKITAQVEPGWHIYAYAKTEPEQGPRPTTFDVFDTGGLKAAGGWKASTAPEVKQEPAFDNMVVAFHEGEVTWSLPLTVPADAPAGKLTVRTQAGYMICNETSCLPAGRWTLADATLTVLPAAAGTALVAPAGTGVAAKPAPAAEAEAKVAATTTAKAESAAGAGSQTPEKTRNVSEVERKAQEGILPLILFSALGGLIALAMPCVWPMVPITVNFFLKQGQKEAGGTTGLAVTYCLAIIGVFTTVGVVCSFLFSATALQTFANNPWLNFAVAGLFLAFGLQLLGLFEIRLPNALLNASAKGEGRGGLVGVIFMALTLTITSFTCTFPVVGGLIVMAAGGSVFYPVIGLATFATVLALPFFLLALSPGLLAKMPRSGDWMNSVKVVGGLVEIGAALKFLNTAELAFVTPENAWFDAQFVLSAWVALAAVCGLYLLGVFRTDHDHEEVKVGPARLVIGTAFLGLALYLAPALFGRPPQSLVYERLVVGLLPPDASELSASPAAAVASTDGAASREVHATDPDPEKAQRQEKRFHGVQWGLSYEEALEKAQAEGKPVLIDFTGVNCANCRLMEARVLPRAEVARRLGEFVTVQLYTDRVPINSITAGQRESLAEKNQVRELDLTNEATNPFYVVVSPRGELLGSKGGYNEPGVFLDFLAAALAKFKKGDAKVASAR